MPTPYWVREGARFRVITPQCQLLGVHCSRDTAAGARPPLMALGLPCRLSGPLGERPHSPGLRDLGPGCTGEGLMSPQVAAVALAKTAILCSGVLVCQTCGHRCVKGGRREWFAHKEKQHHPRRVGV